MYPIEEGMIDYNSEGKRTGVLSLKEYTEITDEAVALVVKTNKWWTILSEVTKLSEKSAELLSNYRGELSLTKLEEPSCDIIQKLAKYQGKALYLNISAWNPEKARGLFEHGANIICARESEEKT